jgi:hypothetical protein
MGMLDILDDTRLLMVVLQILMVVLQVGRSRSAKRERAATEEKARVIDPDDRNPLTGSLNSSQKIRIIQLLGAWEEPLVGAKPTVRVPVMFQHSWHI